MSRGNNVPWTDFDKAWQSVGELKEELQRTELKLQSAARTFAWDRPLPPHYPDRPTSPTVRFENASNVGSHTAMQNTHIKTQENAVIGNGVPSHNVDQLREKKPKLFQQRNKVVDKQRLVQTTLERIVSKLSTDGSSTSTIHRDIKNGSSLPSTMYCHEWLNTFNSGATANKKIVTESSTPPSIGKSSGVVLTAWDRQFLNRELSDFEFAGSPSESISRQPSLVTKPNSAVQRTTFVFQKSNFTVQSIGPSQALPVKAESLSGLHKLKEIVERQRERSEAATVHVEMTDSVQESSSSGERKPVETFIPRTRLIDAATATDSSLLVVENEETNQRVPPLRKISVAPPPPHYEGFSPVKSLIPPEPFKLEMNKVGISPKKRIPKVAKRTRTQSTKPKQVITPFSWREGQRLANEHLGPPPPQVIFKSPLDLPREAVSDSEPESSKSEPAVDSSLNKTSMISETFATESKATDAGGDTTVDLSETPEHKSTTSKTENKENTSPNPVKAAREILNSISDSDSQTENSDEDKVPDSPTSKPPPQPSIRKKRKAGKNLELRPPPPKLRHYDREKVLEYIEKKRLERKKKLQEEQLKEIQAAKAKKEQLQKLYDFQKSAAKVAIKPKPVQPLKIKERSTTVTTLRKEFTAKINMVIHDNIKIMKRIDCKPFITSGKLISSQFASSSESKSVNKVPPKFDQTISNNTSPSLNITQTFEKPSCSQNMLSTVENPLPDAAVSLGDATTLQTDEVKDVDNPPLDALTEFSKQSNSNTTLAKHSTESAHQLRTFSHSHEHCNSSEKHKMSDHVLAKHEDKVCEIHKDDNSISKKHKTSNSIPEDRKSSGDVVLGEHESTDNVSNGYKMSMKTAEKHKSSESISEKHTSSGSTSEKHKSSESLSEKHKSGENVPEIHKGTEDTVDGHSASLIDDSLSGISSLRTASFAREVDVLHPSEIIPSDISAQNAMKNLAVSLEGRNDPKMQRVHEFVQQQQRQNTTKITIPVLCNDEVEEKSSILSQKADSNNGEEDSYASFRERISRIGSMEDIRKFLNSSRSKIAPRAGLVATKSLSITDSESSSHESFFVAKHPIAPVSKEGNVSAQSNTKEWKFPLLSTVPDPHNFVNTWKRKPLVIPKTSDTDKKADRKVELITEDSQSESSVSKPLEGKLSYTSFSTERTPTENDVEEFSLQSESTVKSSSGSTIGEFSLKSENTVGKTSSKIENIGSKTSELEHTISRFSSVQRDSIVDKPSVNSENTADKPSVNSGTSVEKHLPNLENNINKLSFQSITSKPSTQSSMDKLSAQSSLCKPSSESKVNKPLSKTESDVEKPFPVQSGNSEISDILSVEKLSSEDKVSVSSWATQKLSKRKSKSYQRTANESSESEIFDGTQITRLSQIKASDESASRASSVLEDAASNSDRIFETEPSEIATEGTIKLHQGATDVKPSESSTFLTNDIEAINSSIKTASSANAVSSINTSSSVNAVSSANTMSSIYNASSFNVGMAPLHGSISVSPEEAVSNTFKENSELIDELSQHSSDNQDGSPIEDDLEINTKSASQENVSEYLTPENLSDELLRTSESPESRFSDAKVESETKTVQVGLADSFLDPTTITRVVTQAATAAATSAVMAVLESRGSFASKRERPEMKIKSATLSSSSRREYSSDFENTRSTPSDQSSALRSKSQVSSNKEIEEDVQSPLSISISPNGDSEEIKEDIANENAMEDDVSESVKTVQSVVQQFSHDETNSEKHVPDKGQFAQKKRKRSENISSPSPASLSDNDSLPSSALSSSQSTEGETENHAPNMPASDSFTQLTLDMLRRMIQDEELRAREKLSYFKSEEKNLVEKFRIEMRWLQSVKKQLCEKGYNAKLSLIKEKEEELISRLRQERAQLRSLQETYRSYSQKQHALLLEKKKLFTKPNSPAPLQKKERFMPLDKGIERTSISHSISSISPVEDAIKLMDEDKSQADVPEGVFDSSSSAESVVEMQNTSVSKSSHSIYSKHAKPVQSSNQRTSKQESNFSHSSQQSTFSLESILQGLKRLEASKRYLTKKEQRLVQRRKHVEDLLQWQSSLDHEEKDIKELEHKAVEMLEKSKHRTKYYVSSTLSSQKNDSPSQETIPVNQLTISSAEGIPSEREVASSNSLKTTSPFSGTDSVQEVISPAAPPSKSESSSTDKISEDVSIQPQSSCVSTIKEDKMSTASVTITEQVTESRRNSSSNISNEVHALKSSHVSSLAKEKSASSEADSYSDSFILSNDAASSSAPPQHKKLASIKSRLSSSTITRMIGRKNRRQDSSGSDDSFTISHSETASDQSDIEGRIYALTEELRRRRLEAEKLKKEQKKRHSEQLKDKELSLKKQLEAYDKYIQDVSRELEIQLQAAKLTDPHNQTPSSVKPQIKQPRVAKSRQLQKQLSVSSESDVRSSENESSVLDTSLLSKDQKSQSFSQLAKKLRAIETKDSSSEHVRENMSASSSIQTSETKEKESSEIQTKESPSVISTVPDATSRRSTEQETEELIKSPSEQEISSMTPDQKDSGSTSTIASDNNLSYGLEFTSGDLSPNSSKKSEDRSFESSATDIEEKTTPSDKKHEENFSDAVVESSLEAAEVSDLQESIRNDKFPSIESENFESASTINEGSFEEESSKIEGSGKSCDTPNGCKTPPQAIIDPPTDSMVQNIPKLLGKEDLEQVEGISLTPSLSIRKTHSKDSDEQRRLFLVNSIVEDVLDKVCEDTKSIILRLKCLKTATCDKTHAAHKKTVVTSKLPTSLRDIHKKAALSVSETLTESLFRDAVQTILEVVNHTPNLPEIGISPETSVQEEKISTFSSEDGNSHSGDLVSYPASLKEYHKWETTNEPQELQPEKRDSFVEKQEWIDDDMFSPRSETSLQAYDPNLFVRQYPYLYRQIPNKPPPPYTPPSTGQKFIYSKKGMRKETETVNIIHGVTEQLNDVIDECVDFLLEEKAKGLSLKDIDPPPQYLDADGTDLVHLHQQIFKSFMFQLTKEIIIKIYTEVREKPKYWRRHQKLAGKPILPKSKKDFLPRIYEEVQKTMKLKASDQKLGMWSAMKLGTRRRDFVDKIIISELRAEEAEWVNYDDDEFTLKTSLTDSIFTLLVDDTVKMLKDINGKMFPDEIEQES